NRLTVGQQPYSNRHLIDGPTPVAQKAHLFLILQPQLHNAPEGSFAAALWPTEQLTAIPARSILRAPAILIAPASRAIAAHTAALPAAVWMAFAAPTAGLPPAAAHVAVFLYGAKAHETLPIPAVVHQKAFAPAPKPRSYDLRFGFHHLIHVPANPLRKQRAIPKSVR